MKKEIWLDQISFALYKRNMNKTNRILAIILLAVGIVAFVTILGASFLANRALCSDYKKMKQADLSQAYSGTLVYNDRLYAMVGYGISIDPADSQKEEQLSEFLSSRMYMADQRAFAAGCIYVMIISAILAFPLYEKFRRHRGRHILAVCFLGIGLYILYIVALAVFRLAFHVPLYLSHGRDILAVLTGALSVLGGSCALAMLLRGFRFKKIAAIVAIPLVYILFLFSSICEGQLYCEPYEDSFAYVAEIDERVLDENFEGAYYDPDENALIIEGKKYPPQQIENEEYLKGAKRYGAFAYELLDPYSGTSLYQMEQEIETEISLGIYGAYALKAIVWIVLAFIFSKKKGTEGT